MGGVSRIAAEHADTRTKFGATKGHHVLATKSFSKVDSRPLPWLSLPNIRCDNLAMGVVGVGENVLN